jgi:uncharacterized protein involved in type VI secretion and phage assembly
MPKITDRFGRPVSGQMPGLVEGIVKDNKDPELLGRVRVEFPTLPDKPLSDWARLVMPMAGQERGWMTIPEEGDEVLVSFVHGDFNYAIVLGSLYNGVDTPPYANEDQKDNLRVFQSRSGHRLTFDDTDGAERVELILHNEEIRVIWDSANKTLGVYSGKDMIFESKETISLKCKDFILEAQENVSITAQMNIDLQAMQSVIVQAGQDITVKGSKVNLN